MAPSVDANSIKLRTKRLALDTIKLVESMPRSRSADAIARQMVRSAMSIGANYRAACRARSKTEFTAKLGVVEEEADETLYWLELAVESELVPAERAEALSAECHEILKIVVSSIKTSRCSK